MNGVWTIMTWCDAKVFFEVASEVGGGLVTQFLRCNLLHGFPPVTNQFDGMAHSFAAHPLVRAAAHLIVEEPSHLPGGNTAHDCKGGNAVVGGFRQCGPVFDPIQSAAHRTIISKCASRLGQQAHLTEWV